MIYECMNGLTSLDHLPSLRNRLVSIQSDLFFASPWHPLLATFTCHKERERVPLVYTRKGRTVIQVLPAPNKYTKSYCLLMHMHFYWNETSGSYHPRNVKFLCMLIWVGQNVPNRRPMACFFEPTCASCTVGSYASLSVCLWQKLITT